VAVYKVLAGKKIPVYAKGLNVREWLYVSDCAEAVWLALKKGRIGEAYNIGSGQEQKNIDTARMILRAMAAPLDMIEFVKDRPGHDIRYSLSAAKIKKELGWEAKTKFPDGLNKTINWYMSSRP
jgi:dTDP-glucose 4,6-dehydratase